MLLAKNESRCARVLQDMRHMPEDKILKQKTHWTQRNFKFILVVVDYYTRWVEAFPTVHKSAESFANVLNKKIFSRHFYPRRIMSDRDPAFHAQTNSRTERTNKNIIQTLMTMIQTHQNAWPDLLPTVLQKLHGVVNDSTGKSPFEMMFGRLPRMALDLMLCDNQDHELPNTKQADPAKKILTSSELSGMDHLESLA